MDKPLTEVETQKENWKAFRNLFIETSWPSAGILKYDEPKYERAKEIVDTLISQALLSERARLVERLKNEKEEIIEDLQEVFKKVDSDLSRFLVGIKVGKYQHKLKELEDTNE